MLIFVHKQMLKEIFTNRTGGFIMSDDFLHKMLQSSMDREAKRMASFN